MPAHHTEISEGIDAGLKLINLRQINSIDGKTLTLETTGTRIGAFAPGSRILYAAKVHCGGAFSMRVRNAFGGSGNPCLRVNVSFLLRCTAAAPS